MIEQKQYAESDYTPSEEFWKDFASNYWEKNSLAVKNSLIRPPITADELFQLAVESHQPDANTADYIRFYQNGKSKTVEYCQKNNYYPTNEDGSFSNYSKRLKTLLGKDEYVFVVDGFQLNANLREWTMEFLKQMYTYTGAKLTNGHFYSIFFGDYSRTPFGIHLHDDRVEYESAFYFPLQGEKSMRIWTPEYAKKHPSIKDSKQYENFLAGSSLITAEETGLLYWPADRWHIGDAGHDNISIPLAIRMGSDLVLDLEDYIYREMVASKQEISFINEVKLKIKKAGYLFKEGMKRVSQRDLINIDFDPTNIVQSCRTLPDELIQAGEYYRRIVEPIILERAISRMWLAMLSAYGMNPAVSFKEANMPKASDQIQLLKHHKLLLRKDKKDGVILGMGGNSYGYKTSSLDGLEALFENINSGSALNVGDLLNDSLSGVTNSQEECREQFSSLLKFLRSTGMIRVIPY
jgi:50S ribosomal protein L16 3-hydroxylase